MTRLPVVLPLWSRMERAVGLVGTRYGDVGLSLQRLANAADLSVSHFCRTFREYLGVSPHKYLTRVRIDHPRSLLLAGTVTCKQVAVRTGFGSIHVFSKAFRWQTGLLPRRWLAELAASGRQE